MPLNRLKPFTKNGEKSSRSLVKHKSVWLGCAICCWAKPIRIWADWTRWLPAVVKTSKSACSCFWRKPLPNSRIWPAMRSSKYIKQHWIIKTSLKRRLQMQFLVQKTVKRNKPLPHCSDWPSWTTKFCRRLLSRCGWWRNGILIFWTVSSKIQILKPYLRFGRSWTSPIWSLMAKMIRLLSVCRLCWKKIPTLICIFRPPYCQPAKRKIFLQSTAIWKRLIKPVRRSSAAVRRWLVRFLIMMPRILPKPNNGWTR